MLTITLDENIPHAAEAFDTLGQTRLVAGRVMHNADLQETDILVVRSVTKVNAQLLAGTPVRFVATATAGFDHIDLDYLRGQGIGFARAPGCNAVSAAEYVLTALSHWALLRDKPLQGRSIGIIGHGNVGSRVRQLCEAQGMCCVVNDPPLQTPGYSDLYSLEAALACDIVTFHVPFTHAGEHPTFRLLDAARIARLRPGTLLLNTARGGVVDESTLLARLQTRADLDVVLDTWENEPAINLEMLQHTLLGTPHIAGYSLDGKIRGTEMVYRACCEFLQVAPRWESPLAPVERRDSLHTYDIRSDDGRLKALLHDKTLDTARYFDQLRKTYPVRREYSGLS
ncbi:4-phosphoerythronate dehydrogenase [Thiothrix fructosivorans]|uniref:Erythronate-4-phosphate dehydrogenase n=1 Tax=Thiothrix fructosivorans TaxID=111770 RepID=A0A8B0SL49_9GAMM|nr:4-phosphoerythronate dehydrogenase [Thiothrix fructosivorans]MBO0611447.1 4-phosphoerythronate dehydrogenase [Thiothrix fructosivorans]QTX12993.1 4-phosphoerythronate dehydrogenase [Thiothrix fructosivorans]